MERKIKNREAAQDWHNQQIRDEYVKEQTGIQLELLRYAAFKRKTGFPSVHELRDCGMPEAANYLAQAYALIEAAYSHAKRESGREE